MCKFYPSVDAEPPTELMVAMVVAQRGKGEPDQRLAAMVGRTCRKPSVPTERRRTWGGGVVRAGGWSKLLGAEIELKRFFLAAFSNAVSD